MEVSLRNAFSRMGGKSKLAKTIVSKIPPHFETYVELFVGGGSIYLEKKLSKVNVINDIDKDIYHLWTDLRDVGDIDFQFDNSNMSKDKFQMYLDKKEFDTPKERLFRNLYLTKNSFSGDRVRYGYSDNNPDNRRVSKLTYIKNHIKDYQYKLSRTQIHNQDYRSIITQYDSPNTFFYLDPPYSLNRKSWAYNTPLITKEMLLEELKRIQGGFIMSYDYSEDNLKLFGEFFYVLPVDTIYAVLTKARDKKFQEILISNFKIE